MRHPTVVALGGNALVRAGQRGSEPEQRANLREAVSALAAAGLGEPLVVTHGNGPQVGNELLRHERAAQEAPPLPLWLAVGQTQAEIGTLLATELAAALTTAVAVVVTHVRVDEEDPAFAEPTKPVGPFYDEQRARTLERERGWRVGPDAGRGWRRLVASPAPVEVVEAEAVRILVEHGTTVVACGGGGIPVVARGRALAGVDAVIDKDRTSALLAAALGSPRLVVLTDVREVQRGYGTAEPEDVRELSGEQAERLAGTLPAGSMRPKLEACAHFVRATGGEALVTSPGSLADALAGHAGTRIRA